MTNPIQPTDPSDRIELEVNSNQIGLVVPDDHTAVTETSGHADLAGPDQQRAPADFTEIHTDFRYSHNSENIIGLVVCGVILAGFCFITASVFWPLVFKACGFGVLIGWPFLAYYSYKENREVFRYYTWIYRTTKPIKAKLELRSHSSEGGRVFRAKVITLERTYECSVVSTISLRRLNDISKEVDVYFLPDNGKPVVAEDGDLRIWLEEYSVLL